MMENEKFHINPPDVKAAKDFSPGKNMVKYRWIMLLLVVPLFYMASAKFGAPMNFFKMFAGLLVYNIMVTVYLAKDYPRRGKVSKYIYYYDIIAISGLVFMMGGLNSDIYVLYFFVILAFGAANSMIHTMRLALCIIGFYSAACITYGEMQNLRWILSDGIARLAMKNVSIMIVAYAIGLLIIEVKRAEYLHRMEYRKARTDKLTGLPNRHYLEQRLADEVADCDTYDKVLNILVFDIDNFKKFNDTYGHLWGDELLKRFASILDQSIRKSDIAVRFGGEEFLLIIKDIDYVTAKSVGDRVRRSLEKEKIILDDGVTKKRVSVSCGVAQYPTHATDITEVINLADQALYYAKEHGKNMVVGYDVVSKSRQVEQEENDIEKKAI